MDPNFDPFTQNATLLAPDGKTPIPIPVPLINAFNVESVSIGINYGAQIGATLITLVAVLLLTPSSKFRRSSNLLHVSCLTVCLIRNVLIVSFYTSPFNDFYAVWGMDFSHVADKYYAISVAGNSFSLLLTIVVEAALMNQAWTMVMLWPDLAKWSLSLLSGVITLMTIGWKIAYTVVQNKGVLSKTPPVGSWWVIQGSVITNILSISWFCAIFNAKLIHHFITNRGLLPADRALTPMEVLIMTNGVLMIFPVIFAALEWAHFPNFEPGSLTLTLVAILLPLGTLAAQRMARSQNISYATCGSGNSGNSSNNYRHHNLHHHHNRHHHHRHGDTTYLSGSSAPLKGGGSSFATTSAAGSSRGMGQVSVLSRSDGGVGPGCGGFSSLRGADKMCPVDLELRDIDGGLGDEGRSARSGSFGESV